jgi:predicted nuclease of predicted toxin-antitoxin system
LTIWLDAQFSPALAQWMMKQFGITVQSVKDLGMLCAKDPDIFQAARVVKAVVMSKDSDFSELVGRLGAPPQVIWVTCGNTSNAQMRQVLEKTFGDARRLLEQGEPLVEIGGPA